MRITLFMVLLTLAGCATGGIRPFATGGCAPFTEGTPKQKDLWLTCCTQHSLAYWKGGTYEERLQADRELRQCVGQAGDPAVMERMLAGVRVGGSPYLPTEFRWGYGWSWLRGYKKIDREDWRHIQERLDERQERPGP